MSTNKTTTIIGILILAIIITGCTEMIVIEGSNTTSSQITIDDTVSNLISGRLPTANPADCEDDFINGTKACSFASGSLNQVYTTLQVSHEYIEETPLQCHIHWTPSDTEVNNVTWYIEYTMSDSYKGGP